MTLNEGKCFEDALLREIRQCFCHVGSDPIVGPRIFLENAGGALTLKKVVEVVAQQTALPDNAGRANPTSRGIDRLIPKARRMCAHYWGLVRDHPGGGKHHQQRLQGAQRNHSKYSG